MVDGHHKGNHKVKNLNSSVITNALGKAYEHPDVQAIVNNFGLTQVPRAKAKEPDANLTAKKDGIELGFIDADYLSGKKVARYGNADMIFFSATLYITDGEPGYKQYKGELPGGGLITDTLEQHLARLGPPTETIEDAGDLVSRTWLIDNFWLSFSYGAGGEFQFAALILEKYWTVMLSK
jgi:hypothetical protein